MDQSGSHTVDESRSTFASGAGEVVVWQARIGDARVEAALAERQVCLNEEERERAARFRNDAARHRFILGRIMLRHVASSRLGIDPAAIELEISEHGKPRLAAVHGATLRFNIAHSGSVVLVALARGREVGVDVEAWRQLSDRDALIERYFAPAEREALWRVAPSSRDPAFFSCWTRKEALLKAWSTGMTLALDAFAVPVPPAPDAFPALCRNPRDGSGWWLWDLEAGDGYSAAIALQAGGEPPEISLIRWPAATS